MPGVLCCGNIVYDILVRPVDELVWGASAWVESIERHMGGNGANTSYTLAVLGVPVRLAGMAGRDAFGEELLGKLRGAGVDTGGVGRSDAPTATTVVVVNSRGERCLLHRPGVSREAFAAPLDFNGDGLSHCHLANVFSLPGLRLHAAESLQRARAAGLATSMDTGWDPLGRWIADLGPALAHTDLLFVNEDEARMLSGVPVLREYGAREIVVKLGARGCAVFTAEEEIRVPGFQVPVVDTTGAGDCFAGAYLAARMRGRSRRDAARFANAAAALTIQHLGATTGLRPFEETEAWMAVNAPTPPVS